MNSIQATSIAAFSCFGVAALLAVVYALTRYRQAHKPVIQRNVALLVASAVWVPVGILEYRVASWMRETQQTGDLIRADACLFPVALAVTGVCLAFHFRSLKPPNRDPQEPPVADHGPPE